MPRDYGRQSAYTATERMKKWNMSNRQIEDVATLIENQLPPDAGFWSEVEIRHFLVRFRPELLDDFIALASAERLAEGQTDLEEIEKLSFKNARTTQADFGIQNGGLSRWAEGR